MAVIVDQEDNKESPSVVIFAWQNPGSMKAAALPCGVDIEYYLANDVPLRSLATDYVGNYAFTMPASNEL